MSFFSFIVEAPDVMQIPGYMIVLDQGRNVFNAVVPDINIFQEMIKSLGCKVIQVNNLDDFELPESPPLMFQ